MSFLRRIFSKSNSPAPENGGGNEQAVLVYLDGAGLPDNVYEEYDVVTLEDRLIDVIERERAGGYDGNEYGPDVVTLYMYGPDAERLFSLIEPILRSYPLCENARVVIRKGKPGAQEHEVRI